MVDLFGQCRQQPPALANEIGFDFQTVNHAGRRTLFDNRGELLGRLFDVRGRVGPLGVIERESANEFGAQRLGSFDGRGDVVRQILLEWHEPVVAAIVDIEQLHLADGRADARHMHPVRIVEGNQLLQLRLRQHLHQTLQSHPLCLMPLRLKIPMIATITEIDY